MTWSCMCVLCVCVCDCVCTVWCCWFSSVRCSVVGSVQVPGIIVLSYLSLARYKDKYK